MAEGSMPAAGVADGSEGGIDALEPLAPLNNAALATLRLGTEKTAIRKLGN